MAQEERTDASRALAKIGQRVGDVTEVLQANVDALRVLTKLLSAVVGSGEGPAGASQGRGVPKLDRGAAAVSPPPRAVRLGAVARSPQKRAGGDGAKRASADVPNLEPKPKRTRQTPAPVSESLHKADGEDTAAFVTRLASLVHRERLSTLKCLEAVVAVRPTAPELAQGLSHAYENLVVSPVVAVCLSGDRVPALPIDDFAAALIRRSGNAAVAGAALLEVAREPLRSAHAGTEDAASRTFALGRGVAMACPADHVAQLCFDSVCGLADARRQLACLQNGGGCDRTVDEIVAAAGMFAQSLAGVISSPCPCVLLRQGSLFALAAGMVAATLREHADSERRRDDWCCVSLRALCHALPSALSLSGEKGVLNASNLMKCAIAAVLRPHVKRRADRSPRTDAILSIAVLARFDTWEWALQARKETRIAEALNMGGAAADASAAVVTAILVGASGSTSETGLTKLLAEQAAADAGAPYTRAACIAAALHSGVESPSSFAAAAVKASEVPKATGWVRRVLAALDAT
eukprot:TRINITY_DN21546_c0_g1_i1.p1 TRINITY_DN21546_c0_g1~~TRINITY_DN21546_c0_g1_i1.p1  ORF type:complete len:537 (+),score=129.99 TRINITY_DN21546_c0_g1_i1:48-1613(+)